MNRIFCWMKVKRPSLSLHVLWGSPFSRTWCTRMLCCFSCEGLLWLLLLSTVVVANQHLDQRHDMVPYRIIGEMETVMTQPACFCIHDGVSNPASEFLPKEACSSYDGALLRRVSAYPANGFLKHETDEIQTAICMSRLLSPGMLLYLRVD